MTRRIAALVLGVTLVALLVGFKVWSTPSRAEPKVVVRISHFRPSIPATVQKARGNLERKLAPLGAKVEWLEFKVTPDSALAATSGSVDILVGGVEGGLSTIALGAPAKILVTGPHGASRTGWFTALLVRQDSAIRSLSDLAGKRIAVGRGGFSEAVLAVAVRRAGLNYPKDITPVYLPSSDSRNAFVQGSVDAVLTLDPYVVQIQRDVPSRILTDNEQLGYPTTWAVLVLDKFAHEHPDIVDVVAGEFLEVGPWIATHPEEVAQSLAKVVGFDAEAWKKTIGRASYVLERPSSRTISDIQYVADQILELNVISKKVDVRAHLASSPDSALSAAPSH
jgi:sulfonate transport system substrate-binding protein